MTNNTQKYLPAAAVAIIIVAIAGMQYFKKPTAPSNEKQTQDRQGQEAAPLSKTAAGTQAKTLEGTLKVSDNLKKGSLMLVTKDRIIYLRSSRDFSALIGKEVKVSYEGDLNGFKLGDITAK